MIASLTGIVDFRKDPYLIINVNGVGYKVLVSSEVLSKIGSIGTEIKVFTYTHVREDALDLYGFSKQEDLKLFEYLIGVSGIGPKTAIGVFSIGTASEIASAIMSGNVDFFTAVPRLGKKNAQKIIIELKNKFGSLSELDLSSQLGKDSEEVVIALKALGFSTKEAGEAMRSIKSENATTEDKIRMALKYLGK